MLTREAQLSVYQAYQQTMDFLNRKSRSLLRPEFALHSSMYVFTTENLQGYIRKLDVKNKSVLTVTASGDHFLNLALEGASRVDNFDCNKNTYFMTELKIAALSALSYSEFLEFFTDCERRDKTDMGIVATQKKVGDNPHYFDYKTYLKIRPYLEEDVSLYWDFLYEEFEFRGKEMEKAGLFFGGDKEAAIRTNNYLASEKNYEALKEKIEDVDRNYYFLDILKIHELPHTYDVVLLSNIYDYLVDSWSGKITEEEFNQYVASKMPSILKEGAKVAAAYQYHYKTRNAFYHPSLKNLFRGKYTLEEKESLDRFGFRKILVPSVIREYQETGGKDCLYVYESGKVR